jgi:hypothetical protein
MGDYRLQPRPTTAAGRIVIFLLVAFGPVLRLVELVLKALYRVLFSSWLNPAFDHWSRESFANEIKQDFPFLFAQYEGKIVPSPRPAMQSPGTAYVCIAAMNLLFEFSRWRNENYAIRVSPVFAPKDSYELVDALRVVELGGLTTLSPSVENWPFFARFLEPRFPPLATAFNQENFADTKKKLADLRLGIEPSTA